ncbi:ABC transporter ATP-binding protein [Enemella evansiae]|nr:ABC transporter ATP-binding protein [Enemella evansiae]
MAEIRLTNVSKRYNKKSDDFAVRDISYTVADHQFVSLLGPSGCGKSTTLNMIAGLEGVSEGTIEIDGQRVETLQPHKRDLAFVFQDYALYPHLSVYDNIAFGLRMRHVERDALDERVRESAAKLELTDFLKKKPKALSGGQRQRVALARAIARRPGVLLFDEPLSNLDAVLRDRTRAELKLLHNDIRATSVYVTHDQEEAMSLSDMIAVMSRGRLEQYATPEDIYRAPATEFVAGFVGKPQMNLLSAERIERGRYAPADCRFSVAVDLPDEIEVVRLGLRPSECRVIQVPESEADGTVAVVEPLGSHTDVIVDLGPGHFVVRENGFPSVRAGDPVRIDTAGATRHLYDPDSGNRLPGS